MDNRNQSKKAFLLLSGMLLIPATLPSIAQADSCGAIRERYWSCVRESMNNGKCESNVSIPPECLDGGGAASTPKGKSTQSSSPNVDEPKYKRGLFGTKKEIIDTTPIGYQDQKENAPPPKLIRTVNIKPKGKNFLENEEDVNAYLAKVKVDLMEVIKEGRKIRLQFQ